MKRKPAIVSFDQKDEGAIEASKRMTSIERIYLMFELIEIASHFRKNQNNDLPTDELPFITLKRKL